ncbi:MAG: hypothetical protein IT585_00300 [candidate division Zixibacteria bacterium]|nr:hypothetical protein [candidate division Zixibacteria bacterium]
MVLHFTPNQHVAVGAILISTTKPEQLAGFYAAGLETEAPRPVGADHVGLMVSETFLGFERVPVQPRNIEAAVTAWFRVVDVRLTYERFLSLGAAIKSPPTLQPWGETLAEVVDPEGNVIGLMGAALMSQR